MIYFRLLNLQSLPEPLRVEHPNPKIIYQCNFCKSYNRSKKGCQLHQNNMHFLQKKKSQKYIVRQEPLLKSSQSQNQKEPQYHLLFFGSARNNIKYFSCNFCSYANVGQHYMKDHLEKYCFYRPSVESLSNKALGNESHEQYEGQQKEKKEEFSLKMQKIQEEVIRYPLSKGLQKSLESKLKPQMTQQALKKVQQPRKQLTEIKIGEKQPGSQKEGQFLEAQQNFWQCKVM